MAIIETLARAEQWELAEEMVQVRPDLHTGDGVAAPAQTRAAVMLAHCLVRAKTATPDPGR